MASEVVLIRHGATEWSENGRHTGRTDIPLTDDGRDAARELAPRVAKWTFSWCSSARSSRAHETCDLVGLGAQAVVDDDLARVGLRRLRGHHDEGDPRDRAGLDDLVGSGSRR